MDSENAASPLCVILLHQILDLLRNSGANAVEQLGALKAASALVPVLHYRPIAELLAGSDSDSANP